MAFVCNKTSNEEIKRAKDDAYSLYNEGLIKFVEYKHVKKIELEFIDDDDLQRFLNDGLKYVYHDDLERFRIKSDIGWDCIEFKDGVLEFHESYNPTYIKVRTQLYYEDDMKYYGYSEHINLVYIFSIILMSFIITWLIWYSYHKKKIDNRYDNYIIKDYDEDEIEEPAEDCECCEDCEDCEDFGDYEDTEDTEEYCQQDQDEDEIYFENLEDEVE